jgi:hypothetical protein
VGESKAWLPHEEPYSGPDVYGRYVERQERIVL